jgi:hypothetical protein
MLNIDSKDKMLNIKKKESAIEQNPELMLNEMSKLLGMMEHFEGMASMMNIAIPDSEKIPSMDDMNSIINDLSVITKKAENINGSKITLKKKKNKHKNRKQ